MADFIMHIPAPVQNMDWLAVFQNRILQNLVSATIASMFIVPWFNNGARVPGYGKLIGGQLGSIFNTPRMIASPNTPPVAIFGYPNTICSSGFKALTRKLLPTLLPKTPNCTIILETVAPFPYTEPPHVTQTSFYSEIVEKPASVSSSVSKQTLTLFFSLAIMFSAAFVAKKIWAHYQRICNLRNATTNNYVFGQQPLTTGQLLIVLADTEARHKKELEDRDNQYRAELEERNSEYQAELETQKNTYKREALQLRKDVSRLESQVMTLGDEKDQLGSKLGNIQGQISQLKAQLHTTNEQKAQSDGKLSNTQDRIVQLEEELNTLGNLKAQSDSQFKAAQNQIKLLQNEVARESSQKLDAQRDLEEAKKDNVQLKEQLGATQVNADAVRELAKSKTHVASLEKQLEAESKQKTEYERVLNETKSNSLRLQMKITTAQSEKANIERELSKSKNETASTRQDLIKVQQENDNQLKETKLKSKLEIEYIENEHANKLLKIQQDHNGEIWSLKQQHVENMKSLKKQKDQEISGLKKQIETHNEPLDDETAIDDELLDLAGFIAEDEAEEDEAQDDVVEESKISTRRPLSRADSISANQKMSEELVEEAERTDLEVIPFSVEKSASKQSQQRQPETGRDSEQAEDKCDGPDDVDEKHEVDAAHDAGQDQVEAPVGTIEYDDKQSSDEQSGTQSNEPSVTNTIWTENGADSQSAEQPGAKGLDPKDAADGGTEGEDDSDLDSLFDDPEDHEGLCYDEASGTYFEPYQASESDFEQAQLEGSGIEQNSKQPRSNDEQPKNGDEQEVSKQDPALEAIQNEKIPVETHKSDEEDQCSGLAEDLTSNDIDRPEEAGEPQSSEPSQDIQKMGDDAGETKLLISEYDDGSTYTGPIKKISDLKRPVKCHFCGCWAEWDNVFIYNHKPECEKKNKGLTIGDREAPLNAPKGPRFMRPMKENPNPLTPLYGQRLEFDFMPKIVAPSYGFSNAVPPAFGPPSGLQRSAHASSSRFPSTPGFQQTSQTPMFTPPVFGGNAPSHGFTFQFATPQTPRSGAHPPASSPWIPPPQETSPPVAASPQSTLSDSEFNATPPSHGSQGLRVSKHATSSPLNPRAKSFDLNKKAE